jgi:hypothetical protein
MRDGRHASSTSHSHSHNVVLNLEISSPPPHITFTARTFTTRSHVLFLLPSSQSCCLCAALLHRGVRSSSTDRESRPLVPRRGLAVESHTASTISNCKMKGTCNASHRRVINLSAAISARCVARIDVCVERCACIEVRGCNERHTMLRVMTSSHDSGKAINVSSDGLTRQQRRRRALDTRMRR